MKKHSPHCAHASHFIHCLCGHEKQLHAGPEEDQNCTARKCKCEEFSAMAGHTKEQLEHDSIPVEGYADRPVPTR